ncbi:MAG TPA: neutral/alkaline non-lysosomal ceramidase N-terminal domain-containing protein [Bacteroidales bacterium]|nr:neutral/alkaline non-lysosomal ceramidase N-terminal domain-containing protein [Bacteroidales bacterium]
MSRLLFNYGQADITPGEPVLLAGYANRKGLSKDIHRRLTSRCVVIKQEEKILCLVVNDLMDVNPEIINSVKSDICRKTGVEENSVIIVSIHSHSTPEIETGRYDANDRYIDLFKRKVTENACSVISGEFREADIFLGKSECDINIARRDIKPDDGGMAYRVGDPEGLTDREVMVLQLKDKTGERKVTLFNYACHPVTLGYGSNYISTDYPGRAREVVEEKYGGMAVFVNGATGDLNPRETDHTEPQVTDAEGEKLGRAVISAMLTKDMADPDLILISKTIYIPFRDQVITKEHIENEVRRKYSDVTEFFTWKEMLERWKNKVFEMIDRNETGNSLPVNINVLKLGNTVMFFTQGELFVRYQIDLKRHFSDHNLFCITYAHGTGAYIATKEAFDKKSYEADQAYIYEMMPSPLTPEIEKIYLKEALDIVRGLIK